MEKAREFDQNQNQNQSQICDEMFFIMNLVLDGENNPQQQRQLDDHCATCPHCTALYEELCQMQIAMGNLEEMAPSEGFKDRVLAQIATEKHHKAVPLRRQWRGVAGLAACLALSFGLMQSGLLPSIDFSLSATDSAAPETAMMTSDTTSSTAQSSHTADETMDEPRGLALEDEAVAELEEETTITTGVTAMTGDILTPQEQVAQDLAVDDLRWITIETSDLGETFPDGVPALEDWTVLDSGYRYCVVEEESWQEMRALLGFGLGESVGDGQQVFVVILRGE